MGERGKDAFGVNFDLRPKVEFVWLDVGHAVDDKAVGPKAMSLVRLRQIGLRIPAGFCIAEAVFRQHLEQNRLTAHLKSAIDELPKAESPAKVSILSGLRHAIIEAPLAGAIRHQIEEHYRTLGADYVAVRSSATAEDLPEHSFAGQHDTYLGITNIEDCIEGVKKCWASLWTERAYNYRQKNGFDHLAVSMAVIVQSLIAADASGVIFTADPVTGQSDRIIIEAAFGLGEALVAGKVTPDRFVIRKDNLRILSRTIAQKKIECILDDRGLVTEQVVPPEQANQPSIYDRIARKLAKFARKAEIQFGGPQDMEWALHGTEIFFLQSRPITTLGRAQSPQGRWVWSSFPAKEVMPDVVTPVTMSILDNLGEGLFDPLLDTLCIDRAGTPLYDYFAGRVYFNASFWAAVIRSLPGTIKFNLASDAGSNPALIKIVEMLSSMPDEDLPRIRFNRARFLLKLPLIVVGLFLNTPKKGDAIIARMKTCNQKWEQLDIPSLSTEQIVDGCDGVIADFRELLGSALYLFGTLAAFPALEWVCATWLSDKNLAGRLVAGIGNLDDVAAAMDLWQLAVKADSLPELKKALLEENSWQNVVAKTSSLPGANQFLQGWNEFMTRHGHHCRAELELHNPRWSESLDYVLGLLRGYLACIGKVNPVENHRGLAQQRRSLEEQCRRRLKNPIKRASFNFILVRSQNGAAWRENEKSEAIKTLTALRKLLLELGRRLHGSGILANPDDIFFLTLEEIGPVVSGRAQFHIKKVIAERRAEYNKCNSVTPPDVIVGRFDPDTYVPEKVETDSQVLKGLAVSPGMATGKAQVILRTDSATHLEAGEILVAPFTDPGWTPYFLPAAAIVMEQGSLLSHGSIVAREYGIPAVVNVGSATKIIKTGQTIQVDGNSGVVRILR